MFVSPDGMLEAGLLCVVVCLCGGADVEGEFGMMRMLRCGAVGECEAGDWACCVCCCVCGESELGVAFGSCGVAAVCVLGGVWCWLRSGDGWVTVIGSFVAGTWPLWVGFFRGGNSVRYSSCVLLSLAWLEGCVGVMWRWFGAVMASCGRLVKARI